MPATRTRTIERKEYLSSRRNIEERKASSTIRTTLKNTVRRAAVRKKNSRNTNKKKQVQYATRFKL
jgi:hypothetical protein